MFCKKLQINAKDLRTEVYFYGLYTRSLERKTHMIKKKVLYYFNLQTEIKAFNTLNKRAGLMTSLILLRRAFLRKFIN